MRLPTTISSSKAGSTPASGADGVCADTSSAARQKRRSQQRRQAHQPATLPANLGHVHANFLVIDVSLEPRFLNRRQDRERLARHAVVPMASACAGSSTTSSTRAENGPRRQDATMPATTSSAPANTGLDAAVTPVSHPALQTKPPRLMLDPGPVAHALHPAADHYPPDRATLIACALRNSASRAFTSVSRVTRARQIGRCEAGQGLWRHPLTQRFKRRRERLCVAAAIGAWPCSAILTRCSLR